MDQPSNDGRSVVDTTDVSHNPARVFSANCRCCLAPQPSCAGGGGAAGCEPGQGGNPRPPAEPDARAHPGQSAVDRSACRASSSPLHSRHARWSARGGTATDDCRWFRLCALQRSVSAITRGGKWGSRMNDGNVGAGPEIELEVVYTGKLTYAYQQNDVPVVRELAVANRGTAELSELKIRAEVESGVAKPWEAVLQKLGPGETRKFTQVDMRLDAGRLANLLERERTALHLTVTSADRRLAEQSHPLEVLAFNEWPGVRVIPEIISAFVCPNHPAIGGMLDAVHEEMRRLTGSPSLDGYQSNSRDRARKMVAAIYHAMKSCRIRYINPPASFDTGQKIRTPDEVLREPRSGTCLDLAVVAAALMEQIGLHPLLVIIKGHAFVGAWLQDTQFAEPAIDDAARIINRVGLDEMVVFETTTLVDGTDVPFESSVRTAMGHLARDADFIVAIDVHSARKFNILPLPPRVQSGDGYVVVESRPAAGAASAPVERVRDVPEGPATSTSRSRQPRPAPAGLPPEAVDRLERWKRKLLDLSLRNPLLNFKEESRRGVKLLVSDVAMLEDRLIDGEAFSLAPRTISLAEDGVRQLELETQRSGRDIPAEVIEQEFQRGMLRVDVGDAFAGRLTELFRDARTAVEETGSGTLYLAIGALRWFETDDSQQPRLAPLLLMPARIERPQPGQFRLLAGDGDATVNVTLIEKLKHDFQIDASSLLELEQDEAGIDVRKLFRAVREVIKDIPRWEVRETAFLGHFSFAKFMLYTDLNDRLAEVAQNPTVNFILTRNGGGDAFGGFPDASGVDHLPPESSLCPLDADSSQQVAVESAIAGKTFVLQGPPGTGKSQTITNLIARAIASGKRVLFVAEKLAALNVVRSRLQAVGVGPYVLELHSNKANKKEVLDQIRAAMEATTPRLDGNWQDDVEELAGLRRGLNDYVAALHKPRPSGETGYQVISRLNVVKEAPAIDCTFHNAFSTTATELKAKRSSIDAAARAARALGGVTNHPLQGIRLTSWRPDLSERIRQSIQMGLDVVAVLRQAIADWLGMLGYEPSAVDALRVGAIQPLYHFTRTLLQRDAISVDHFAGAQLSVHLATMTGLIAAGRQLDGLRSDLNARYEPAFLDADHAALAEGVRVFQRAGFLARLIRKPRLMREIRRFTRGGSKPNLPAFVVDCERAREARELAARLASSVVAAPQSDWNAIEQETKWAAEVARHLDGASAMSANADALRASLSRLYGDGSMSAGQAGREAAERFLESVKSLQQALKELEQSAGASQSEITGRNVAPLVQTLESTLRRWLSSLPALPDWTVWQAAIGSDDAKSLKPYFEAMLKGELSPAQLKPAFESTYARAWLNGLFDAEPSLQRFTYDSHGRLIEDFRAVDRRVMEQSRRVLARTVASQRPGGNMTLANPSSELGILKRQLQLQRRHMAVRRLVRELPTILPKLKPVWLMSPLSVAQFLDPSTPPFDLVVFDEASQIPVWDAIGALARAERAVVVGDSRQLPPTNFFQRQDMHADDEDVELEELESILDECVAASIPELKLRWHYRSRHESLIAFSNSQYYDNHLHTFPSADVSTERLGVSLRYLPDATYDRGGSRQNLGEARAIVEEIFKRLSETSNGSIGVVTFSVAQQQLIEDLIDAELAAQPQFRRFFDAKEPEYVFVKNLENVQGDERDVIFFSICYGKTPTGKLSMSFGPLNSKGGERRLNVAITRARLQVVVFSSIKAEHIDLSRSRARGVADLRSFLDFAERGPQALLEIVSVNDEDQFDSPFEQEVCRALRERGWTVDTQVGCSGYRIDMAVRDPDRPGRYLIGVECDGASYHSAASARDRDRLREEVLTGLGWRLHRVWSTDWMQQREKALQRLLLAIELAKEQAAMPAAPQDDNPSPSALPNDEPPVDLKPEVDDHSQRLAGLQPALVQSTLPPGARLYELADLQAGQRTPDAFYAALYTPAVLADLRAILAVESPIHIEEVSDRVARAWGLQRVTRRVQDRIDELLARDGIAVSADQFIRNGDGSALSTFRVLPDGVQRKLERIAPEELRAAMKSIVDSQGNLPEASLVSEVAKLFGYTRVRESAKAVIRSAMPPNQLQS